MPVLSPDFLGAAPATALGRVQAEQAQEPDDRIGRDLAEKGDVQEIAIVEEPAASAIGPSAWVGPKPSMSRVSGVIPTPNAPPGDDSRMASVIRSTEELTAGCSGG